MRPDAKAELAAALLASLQIHAASWDKERSTYLLNQAEAAVQAGMDPELAPLIVAMLGSGCADFPQWAETIKRQYGLETEMATDRLMQTGRQLTIV